MSSNFRRLIAASSVLATVVWLGTPIDAQRGRGGGGGGGGARPSGGAVGGGAVGGGQARVSQAQPRSAAPPSARPAAPTRGAQAPMMQPRMPPQQRMPSQMGAQPQQRMPSSQGMQSSPRMQPTQRMQQPQGPSRTLGATQSTPRMTQQRTPQQSAPARNFASQQQTRPQPQTRSPQMAASARTEQARPQAAAPTMRQGGGTERTASGRQIPTSTVYRSGASPRVLSRPGAAVARSSSVPRYAAYAGGHAAYVQPRHAVFAHSYYTFRPCYSLGWGISVGYAVAYPFTYYDPYAFYNYGIGVYPGYGTYGYTSSSYYNRVGGLTFEIDPIDAAVFIDGEYVGVAGDFGPSQMPLTLTAGRHRVDLNADGYLDVSFDITIVAGQVIPYRGTMPFGR